MKALYGRYGFGWRANAHLDAEYRSHDSGNIVISIAVAFAIVLLVSRVLSVIDDRLRLTEVFAIPTAHAAAAEAQYTLTTPASREVAPGETVQFRVGFKNLTSKAWAYAGDTRMTLKASSVRTDLTTLPRDYWYAGDTVARIEGSSVRAGETAYYAFSTTAPTAPGTYYRTFTLVYAGQRALPESEFTLTFIVRAPAAAVAAPAPVAVSGSCERAQLFEKNIQTGSPVSDVRALQTMLQCLGFFPVAQTATGSYGPVTIASVKAFQASLKLQTVGVVGPATRAALNAYPLRTVAAAVPTMPPAAPVPVVTPTPVTAPTTVAEYQAVQAALAQQQFQEAQQEAANRPLTDREKVAAKYGTAEALQKVLQQCSALRISAVTTADASLRDDCKQLGVWSTNPETPVTNPGAAQPGAVTVPSTSGATGSAIEQNTDPIAGSFGELGPTVRVGLYVTDSVVTITANNEYLIKDGQGTILATVAAGRGAQVSYSPLVGLYTWTVNGVSVSTSQYIRFEPNANEAIFEITSFESRPAWNPSLNDNRFYGVLELRYNSSKKRTWVINELPMEKYIEGLAESTNSSPMEYQKALITAARTYAMHHYLRGTKHGDEYFTVDAVYDQVYKGYNSAQRLTQVRDAVAQTRGQVVTYDGKVAVTPYFSWSDGSTRSWKEVWGQEIPWAQAVTEPAGYDKTTMFGHGVGMSARGAIILAADYKYNFEQILKYYYTGVTLKKIY